MLFTWYNQDRFSSKWIPKTFCVWTLPIASPLCITLNNSLLLRLCLWLSWELSLLKTKLLLEDHIDTVSRSDFNSSIHFVRSLGFEVESLAYCNESQMMFSTKSTTYKLKRTGPKMLPCGTPNLLNLTGECLSWTNCFRPET